MENLNIELQISFVTLAMRKSETHAASIFRISGTISSNRLKVLLHKGFEIYSGGSDKRGIDCLLS
jgi:hypothetical protein